MKSYWHQHYISIGEVHRRGVPGVELQLGDMTLKGVIDCGAEDSMLTLDQAVSVGFDPDQHEPRELNGHADEPLRAWHWDKGAPTIEVHGHTVQLRPHVMDRLPHISTPDVCLLGLNDFLAYFHVTFLHRSEAVGIGVNGHNLPELDQSWFSLPFEQYGGQGPVPAIEVVAISDGNEVALPWLIDSGSFDSLLAVGTELLTPCAGRIDGNEFELAPAGTSAINILGLSDFFSAFDVHVDQPGQQLHLRPTSS